VTNSPNVFHALGIYFYQFNNMKSLDEITAPVQQVKIGRYTITDNGQFPNNATLPLLTYIKVIKSENNIDSKSVMDLLESNGWMNAWENGIYDYHHYHSITHEVLVVISGGVRVQFGGEDGIAVELVAGDVVIIPAGVAHKKLSEHSSFKCVGAYPDGRDYDVLKGKPGERPKADENIKSLPIPDSDPIYGMNGPLLSNWQK
jgi:uncharacterized protein YjlB